MIAAPVQCDVDGIPKGSHYVRVPIAIGRPNGLRFSGSPSERSERPSRSEGRRVRCKRVLGPPTSQELLELFDRRPASRMMPPIVKAFTGLCLGIVRNRTPSVMTACLPPCRAARNPAFSSAGGRSTASDRAKRGSESATTLTAGPPRSGRPMKPVSVLELAALPAIKRDFKLGIDGARPARVALAIGDLMGSFDSTLRDLSTRSRRALLESAAKGGKGPTGERVAGTVERAKERAERPART
jgi:hypothetical protein